MARGLRRMLPDGLFHVTTNAVHEEFAFRDDVDRVLFLRLLAIAVRRHRWRVHAYCLLGTHYHLVVDATQPQLSRGLHFLNGVYAQACNKRHGRKGHLFRDRFASWVIDDEALRARARVCPQQPGRGRSLPHPGGLALDADPPEAGLDEHTFDG